MTPNETPSKFQRQLDARHMQIFEKLAAQSAPHWWKDLLGLWRPSGIEAGVFGLRLAIRNGYLNFYRRGQSIARVVIDSQGVPTVTTHIKYLGLNLDSGQDKQYGKLQNNQVQWKLADGATTSKIYRGVDDLKAWIAITATHAGPEKSFVDELVTANSNIIDLEMGLPAWGDVATAPRMDIVAVESTSSGRSLVFWEAKLEGDGRMRIGKKSKQSEEICPPKVWGQLEQYRKYLSVEEHREVVADAYRSAADILVELRGMANKLGENFPLGEEILAAAVDAKLGVNKNPRLVVLLNKERKDWTQQKQMLRKDDDGNCIFIQDIEISGPFELRAPT